MPAANYFTGNHIKLQYPLHLITKEIHTDGLFSSRNRKYLYNIPQYSEFAADKVDIISFELYIHQLSKHRIPIIHTSFPQGKDQVPVFGGVAQTVNAGHAGHNNHIPPLKEGTGGRVAQLIYLFIDGRVFFNIGVSMRNIGLGLIVIVVADKILHRVFREKLLKFRAELGSQSLVGSQHQSRFLQLLNNLGHGICFSTAGNPQQCLMFVSPSETIHKLLYGPGLIPAGAEI